MYHNKYKGSGLRKLLYYYGLKQELQSETYKLTTHVPPKFTTKFPLKPVQSAKVLNQVQINLVNMSASPSTTDTQGVTYKYYILVVCWIFSVVGFVFPLWSKSSAEISQRLPCQIWYYCEHILSTTYKQVLDFALQVNEINHHMHGLTQFHLPSKGACYL